MVVADEIKILQIRKMGQREQSRRNYDRLSRWYDLLTNASEWRIRQTGLLILDANPGERILEIGFGTGHIIVSLAQSVGDSGQVCGIDLSPNMLSVAYKRVQDAGLAARVILQLGDATSLPFPAESFDALIVSFTLELFADDEVPIVLSECFRVLRPHGRICVAALSANAQPGGLRWLYALAHRVLPSVIDCHPIDVPGVMIAAGLDIIASRRAWTWGLPIEIILARKAD